MVYLRLAGIYPGGVLGGFGRDRRVHRARRTRHVALAWRDDSVNFPARATAKEYLDLGMVKGLGPKVLGITVRGSGSLTAYVESR